MFEIAPLLPKGLQRIEILDIGAAPEGTPRYAPLLAAGLAAVTGFEPQAMQRRLASEGDMHCLPHMLGDGSASTFHATFFPGCSSLLAPDPAVIDLFTSFRATGPGGNFSVEQTETVQTTRLDDIADLPLADFIKIDVQGAELAVLENGVSVLANALVIDCEVEFIPLYKDQPLFSDIDRFLRSQGFLLHRMLDVSGRCFRPVTLADPTIPVSQWLWADAVFVRDFVRLEHWSDLQLVKGAAILHEVYRSFDLALRLLNEFDRRTGADCGARYAATLDRERPPSRFVNVRTGVATSHVIVD